MSISTANMSEFLENPTHKGTAHPIYKSWFFSLQTMPENATSEMIFGSLQRKLGLAHTSEGKVAQNGLAFLKRVENLKSRPSGANLDPQQFLSVLLDVLDCPKTPSQAASRAFSVLPLVPELANYTAAVRLRGSPWNPGQLAAEAIILGSRNASEAKGNWINVYEALQVRNDDDLWARFVAAEVRAWRPPDQDQGGPTGPIQLDEGSSHWICLGEDPVFRPPARQLIHDLREVLTLRDRLARREWLAYLESLLRLGLVAHSQWLCHIHTVVWQEVEAALTGAWSLEGLEQRLKVALRQAVWAVGEPYTMRSTALARRYLNARFGLNLVLFELDKLDSSFTESLPKPQSFETFVALIRELAAKAGEHTALREALVKLAELKDQNPAVTNCRSGFTNNLREFWLYALSKRQTLSPTATEFDQGYWCQKRSPSPSAPWVAIPGPLALGLSVHCCIAANGPGSTVQDLQKYLLEYGISIQLDDFAHGAMAVQMRGLGVIVDSPDAEGGMGLIDPLGGIWNG